MKPGPEDACEQDIPVTDNIFGQTMKLVDMFEHELGKLRGVVVYATWNQMDHGGKQADNHRYRVVDAIPVP